VHVPYKGNGPAYTDLISGQVPVMFPNITTALQHVRSGKLRALAVTGKSRTRLAPDIPTVAESGLPGYEMNSWFAIMAPAGIPKAVVDKYQVEVARALADPGVREQFIAQGLTPVGNTPSELAVMLRAQLARYSKVIREAGITAS